MDTCPMKHVNSNTRKVDFREENIHGHNETCAEQVLRYWFVREYFNMTFFSFFEQKQMENKYAYENMTKLRKKRSRNNEPSSGYYCNDFSYLTDRGGEADDENSQQVERPIRKHYLDEKPQKENTLLESSDESILDYYEGLDMEPILKSMFKHYKLEILLHISQNLQLNFTFLAYIFSF